ncbi:MAG: hypothetical protein R2741_09545 [Methanolobus sp.]
MERWNSSIESAKSAGAMVIGYNLPSNITLSNIDLYSDSTQILKDTGYRAERKI